MNLLALTAFINGLTSFSLGVFAFWRGKKRVINLSFFLFSLSLTFWSVFYFIWQTTSAKNTALFYSRLLMAVAIFIPVTYLQYIYTFFGDLRKHKKMLSFIYGVGAALSILCFHPLFIADVSPKLNFPFWPDAGKYFWTILLFWVILILYGIFYLTRVLFSPNASALRKNQTKYLLIATVIGSLGGMTNFPLWFDINIYPFGNISTSLYVSIIAITILKYRLMAIRVVLSNTSIFLFVYAFVLGIPLWLGFKYNIWQHATWIAILLATAGPFIYLYLQKRAEKQILQEEHRIQSLLLQASYGMNTIRGLEHLLKLIRQMLIKILKVNRADIYLFDSSENSYVLNAPSSSEKEDARALAIDDTLIEKLKENKVPLVYEEVKMSTSVEDAQSCLTVAQQMEALKSQVIVPIIINETLLGVLALGKRKSQDLYSKGLLNALTVLGNQAALAIQNCRFMAAETKRVEEEGVRERMLSLDHMASSMAHEIDNPNSVIINQASLTIELLNNHPDIILPQDVKEEICSGLQYIKDSSRRVSEMIRAILEYSRMGSGELKPITVYGALDSFEKLIAPQLKKTQVQINKAIEPDLPYFLGDKVQMEEVLMNLTTNALHAVQHNQGDKCLALKIFKKDEKTIRMEFTDNGYGIAPNILKDIFLASVTTKGSVEGTGLGLFRLRKIADKWNAALWAESEGKGKGACFIMEIPVYEQDLNNVINNDTEPPRKKNKAF